MKKVIKVIFVSLFMLLLVACGQRNDLKVSDFPSIGSGMTESELVKQVGNPHDSSSNYQDVFDMQLQLVTMNMPNGYPILDYDKNWNVVADSTVDKYLIYKLENGKVMVALVKKGNIVALTRDSIEME